MIRVRVRGLAATALSKLLIDKGYSIVQASSVIRNRLGLETDISPADVTIKDSGEDEILVIGFYDKAMKIYGEIVNELEYVFKWFSKTGLYSIHIGVVIDKQNNDCVVDIGLTRGLLNNCRHSIGDKVVVSVIKAPLKPGETAKLSYSLRVVGEYVTLIHGSSQVTFSEHIFDETKREYLLTLAVSKLIGSRLGIHFRSSSMYASEESIVNEIDLLRQNLVKILEECKNRENAPRKIYDGEFIGIIGLTSIAKNKLDYLRNKVVPTIPLHHSFKTISGVYSDLIDFVEKIISNVSVERFVLEKSIIDYVYEKLLYNPRVDIVHIKPDGSRRELTPGQVHSVEKTTSGFRVFITRTIRSNGVYDGLGVERKGGDTDLMFLELNNWFISHNYFRNNEWIGGYININTPIEILPGVIKYHDLLIDIIVKPGEEPRVIDSEEFDKYCSEGIISEKTCSTALEKTNEILKNIDNYVIRNKQ